MLKFKIQSTDEYERMVKFFVENSEVLESNSHRRCAYRRLRAGP